MTDLILILIATVLVNNFVLAQFLGLCPFFGVSGQLETALGMSLATAFVLTLSSGLSYLIQTYVLTPFDLTYLRTITFVLIIATMVQTTEIFMRRNAPLLHQSLGIYLPLITTNCAVLGVALLNAQSSQSLLHSLVYGFGAAAGFGLVLCLFAGLRDRLVEAEMPASVRGSAIILITAGIMSLAFMGFSGLDRFF